MPLAIRIIDKVADLADWDASSFLNGYYAVYDAVSGKYIGVPSSGGGGSGSSLTLTGLNTSAITESGLFGYVSANGVVALADNTVLSKSNVIGATNSIDGEIITAGLVVDAQFTFDGGSPNPGEKVYLAANADDFSTGAGKLTATVPGNGILVVVGICLDNSNYSLLQTAEVVIRIREPIIL